ncbi:MAG: RNA-binding transcriptional accessory protein, partial [Youngiibacter sp.]|nr:RNA-binding transcriptional accessory protein [Youngiibacter sp.]
MDILQKIAKELGVAFSQVEGAVKLLDEGATVPFIARYRKEATGSLDDEALRKLAERLVYLRALEERKEGILKSLEEQGVLTDELKADVLKAETQTRLEDIYLPFRPKKRTRATIAREKGLEPLSIHIMKGMADVRKEAQKYISEAVATADEAIAGAMDIIAESVSEDPATRGSLRALLARTAVIVTSGSKENTPYETYYDYREEARKMPGHRILAINRGEKEEILKV